MSFYKKSSVIAVLLAFVVLTSGTIVIAQQEAGEVPFFYPDPRTVGVRPHVMQGKPAGNVTGNRVAGVPEQERMQRMMWDQHLQECEGVPGYEKLPCPLCVESPVTPCKTCKMCQAGFPCEKALCRHCVLPRSKNMSNSCDLAAGDEPCGTCDSCREHRSDPCEHADSGYGPRGEFNPYREPRFLSVIPRPILDGYNNGARKFPVYYNPAPYYRATWNPSTLTAYARPYTHRWSCPLCFRDPCGCNRPGLAGQVAYAYTCKFCNRHPCACTGEICDVSKPMDPAGISKALADMKEESGGAQPIEIHDTTPFNPSPSDTSPGGGGNDLFNDDAPVLEPGQSVPSSGRPSLDAPTPGTQPSAGSNTMSRTNRTVLRLSSL